MGEKGLKRLRQVNECLINGERHVRVGFAVVLKMNEKMFRIMLTKLQKISRQFLKNKYKPLNDWQIARHGLNNAKQIYEIEIHLRGDFPGSLVHYLLQNEVLNDTDGLVSHDPFESIWEKPTK